jgi:hypothetical protein
MNPTKALSKYGEVKTCKVVHEYVATIVITKGFDANAVNTFNFLNDCIKCFPNHPILETCITEPNFGMVVLTALSSKKN